MKKKLQSSFLIISYLLCLGTFSLAGQETKEQITDEKTIDPELVDIQKVNPTIKVDLFLADPNNFLGKALYPENARAYIDKNVAEKLNAIQKELAHLGLGLKIKDAYRPLSVQKELWSIALTMNLKNPGRYVSDPNKEGGRHPRGVAVDLTLIRLKDGSELPMPPFGFTERAHQGYIGDLMPEQIENRDFLKELMMRYGFVPIRCEWWHYNLPNFKEYTAMDLSFDEMKLLEDI